jgi:hypothetical protein
MLAGIAAGLAVYVAGAAWAAADEGIVLDRPEVVVIRHGANESVSLPGTAYSEWQVSGDTASVVIADGPSVKAIWRLRGGGITSIVCAPAEGRARLTLHFRRPPSYSIANAAVQTDWRRGVPQVVLGFGFPADTREHKQYPVAGSFEAGTRGVRHDEYGSYKLPEFEKVHYSDALVTLKVTNADFRDILWLLSSIGNVSIMLDPYWADEPTGSRRPPGAGVGSAPPGGGEGGQGFRGAGSFGPLVPPQGSGRLSLNFDNVPFDQALDLILMAVGLVKVDIYPGESP